MSLNFEISDAAGGWAPNVVNYTTTHNNNNNNNNNNNIIIIPLFTLIKVNAQNFSLVILQD